MSICAIGAAEAGAETASIDPRAIDAVRNIVANVFKVCLPR